MKILFNVYFEATEYVLNSIFGVVCLSHAWNTNGQYNNDLGLLSAIQHGCHLLLSHHFFLNSCFLLYWLFSRRGLLLFWLFGGRSRLLLFWNTHRNSLEFFFIFLMISSLWFYLAFVVGVSDGGRLLKFENNHKISIIVEVHAQWVDEFDQVWRVSYFNHLLSFFAHWICTREILEAWVCVEFGRVKIEIVWRLAFFSICALVSKKFKLALTTLLGDAVKGAQNDKSLLSGLVLAVNSIFDLTHVQFLLFDDIICFFYAVHECFFESIWWDYKSSDVGHSRWVSCRLGSNYLFLFYWCSTSSSLWWLVISGLLPLSFTFWLRFLYKWSILLRDFSCHFRLWFSCCFTFVVLSCWFHSLCTILNIFAQVVTFENDLSNIALATVLFGISLEDCI